ncbi:hypothetical protein Efla_007581 [Eimeria flavescens]
MDYRQAVECKSYPTHASSKALKPGLQQRTLAAGGGEGEDREDEARDSIFSECLATAEESGTALTPFAPPAEDAEDPAGRQTSLEQYPCGGAPAPEAAQPSQQPTSQFFQVFSTSPSPTLNQARWLFSLHGVSPWKKASCSSCFLLTLGWSKSYP